MRGASGECAITLMRCLVVGGLLGSFSSLLVNSSLIEVSISPFFAVAFGLLFISSGIMMAAQMVLDEQQIKNRWLLLFFILLNVFSGATCFMLERDWSRGLSASSKIPLYAVLGSSLAFSVNFASLDLLARFECLANAQLLVRAEWQLRVVAVTSVCTGALWGFTFGALDVEDAIVRSPAAFREVLHREAALCYPVGAASGAFAALAARLLEVRAERRDPDLAYSLRFDAL